MIRLKLKLPTVALPLTHAISDQILNRDYRKRANEANSGPVSLSIKISFGNNLNSDKKIRMIESN